MIQFITDVRGSEPDILTSLSFFSLSIIDLDGAAIQAFDAPCGGWTHSRLVSIACALESKTAHGAEAYLGTSWVGSTEL